VPVALLLAAVLMGIALGTVGAGGSILAVPALVYLGGLAPHDATVVSLLVVGASALTGAVVHAAGGRVDRRIVVPIIAGGFVGTAIGAAINQRLDGRVLLGLLAVAMLVAAARMWKGQVRSEGHAPHRAWPTLAAVGVALGIVTGLLGIGGGFLVVPLLVLVVGVPMRDAVGTSLVLIAASAFSALAAQLLLGTDVSTDEWTMGAVVAAFGAAGVVGGTRIAARLRVATLQRVFAIGLVPVALFMLADAAALVG
jgi:uncharacterized membrane protein YfcA